MISNKDKRKKKLDRRARQEAGRLNGLTPKKPKPKKAYKSNPQRPNPARRIARRVGSKKAQIKFLRLTKLKEARRQRLAEIVEEKKRVAESGHDVAAKQGVMSHGQKIPGEGHHPKRKNEADSLQMW